MNVGKIGVERSVGCLIAGRVTGLHTNGKRRELSEIREG
jgi:hypothetical protein